MKHPTKTVKLFALLCLAALLLPTLIACSGLRSSGSWGELSWTYSKSTKTLTVTGSGDMKDFATADDVAWKSVRKKATTLVVGEGVTSIGNYAFYYMPALTTVQLPTTLASIGDHSFAFCSALTTVSMPERLTTIGASAFEGCGAMTSVYLPTSVVEVKDLAFAFCYSLKNVMVTAETIEIGSQVFRNCRSLKQLTFRSSITEDMVAEDTFAGTSLTFADITPTDKLLGSTTVTVHYILAEEEFETYQQTFGYGVTYSVKSPVKEGYSASIQTISGMADGKDREETVTYFKTPKQEKPKVAISSASMIGASIMIVALVAIGVVVFLLIRSDKPSKRSKRNQEK